MDDDVRAFGAEQGSAFGGITNRVENMADLTARRSQFAEELSVVAGLRSRALIRAFATVPRERFLGPGPWHILVKLPDGQVEYQTTEDADPGHLYNNVVVAIDRNRRLN